VGIPAQKQINFAQPPPISNQFDQSNNGNVENANNNANNNVTNSEIKNTDTPAPISNSVNDSFMVQAEVMQ